MYAISIYKSVMKPIFVMYIYYTDIRIYNNTLKEKLSKSQLL
jgi:hypothetical protein